MMKQLVCAAATLTLAACTNVKVRPVDQGIAIKHVCIHLNPAVRVADFVMVMEDGFQRHGISTETFSDKAPARCRYQVEYTALRSWDFSPYLSHAEIRIVENGMSIASATYHLNGKGGLDLGKWKGTPSKIGPVMDQLLAGIH